MVKGNFLFRTSPWRYLNQLISQSLLYLSHKGRCFCAFKDLHTADLGYSWFCTQNLLLALLKGHNGVPEIKPRTPVSKASAQPAVLQLQSPIFFQVFFCKSLPPPAWYLQRNFALGFPGSDTIKEEILYSPPGPSPGLAQGG